MTASFGARLRARREQQGVSLEAIAADTKIKMSLLEALERDDVSQWPRGIFRRAYIRAYARAIGVEPDAVVREFMDLYPDTIDVLPAGAVAWPEDDGDPAVPPPATRFQRLIRSAIAAVPTFLQGVQTGQPARVVPDTSARLLPLDDPVRSQPLGPNTEGRGEGLSGAEGVQGRTEPDLAAIAQLCSRLAQVRDAHEVGRLLEKAADLLHAAGVILWLWDRRAAALMPALASGYPDSVLARFPTVPADAANAVAAAFRSAEPCVVNASDGLLGALAVPLVGPRGCVGVLALELRDGGEQHASVRGFVTILAAQMATLFGSEALAEAANS